MNQVQAIKTNPRPNVAWPTSEDLRLMTQGYEQRRLYFACKRVLDFSLAAILLAVLSPVMLLLAILVVLDTPGSAIFRQHRVGLRRRRNGRRVSWTLEIFTLYKFRSMIDGADSKIHRDFTRALLRNDQAAVKDLLAGEAHLKKMTKDTRITRFGRFLRKSSLDELPQLWNVLKGDMGLVGPRPPTVYEAEMYDRLQCQRMGAIPGLTGLWQVNGRCCASYEDMIRLDLEYIQNQSLWLDLKILVLTPLAVLRARGAA